MTQRCVPFPFIMLYASSRCHTRTERLAAQRRAYSGARSEQIGPTTIVLERGIFCEPEPIEVGAEPFLVLNDFHACAAAPPEGLPATYLCLQISTPGISLVSQEKHEADGSHGSVRA